MKDEIVDYRGDCGRAYLDVGLCLGMLPTGESFEFIVEREKLEKIRKVVSHNGGRILRETILGGDVRLKVQKASSPSIA